MLRKALVLVVVLCVGGTVAAQKDKDKGKEAKKPAGTPAKVLKVDVDKFVLSVEFASGKKADLRVNKATKFFGPRGGVRDAGIKDDVLKPGAAIRVVVSADGKTAQEVHLPFRKGKKKPKDKDKK